MGAFSGGIRVRGGKVLKSGSVIETLSIIFPSTFRIVGCPDGLTMSTNSVPLTPVRVLGAFLKLPGTLFVCVCVCGCFGGYRVNNNTNSTNNNSMNLSLEHTVDSFFNLNDEQNFSVNNL